jgi:hypothetical protein
MQLPSLSSTIEFKFIRFVDSWTSILSISHPMNNFQPKVFFKSLLAQPTQHLFAVVAFNLVCG